MKLSFSQAFGLVFLFATTTVDADYQLLRFDVKATTFDELLEQFESQSTSGTVGYTTSKTRIKKTLQGYRGGCKLKNIEFSHDIRIYMPRWINKSHAKQCLQRGYEKMWINVMQHELRHREIYRLLDRQMVKQLQLVGSARNCQLLDVALDRRYKKLIAENNARQKRFHETGPKMIFDDCDDL